MTSNYRTLPTMGGRAMARLDALSAITDEPGRLTRFYLSPAHRRAVEAVGAMMQDAGCDQVFMDDMGTVIGRYEGTTPGLPALVIGSHIDTVRDAGSYDGTLGVVAGIGIVESLRTVDLRLPFAVEVMAFGDEENVRFPTNLSSSRAVAGTMTPGTLDAHDEDGISVREALVAFGCDPERASAAARRREDVLAYVEIHIEQGPVLEAKNLPVGVVTAINGASRRRVTVEGEAGHAGTVPMSMRRDALACAAEIVGAVERLGAVDAHTVATVGRLVVHPNAVNVVPGRVGFTLDMRGPADDVREKMVEVIETAARAVAARRGLELTVEPFYDAPACPCDERIVTGFERAIHRLGITPYALPSGAGHDAMAMAALCPVGMLFVRCKGGISHNPAESVTEEDVDVALRVLFEFVRDFGRG